MCKYASSCELCGYAIEVKTEHQNMQEIKIEIASDCPNVSSVTNRPIILDAIKELMVTKEKSEFYHLLDGHRHPEDCTLYDNVKDAIGRSLGRYYEIA